MNNPFNTPLLGVFQLSCAERDKKYESTVTMNYLQGMELVSQ
jgi:hypothetical protein